MQRFFVPAESLAARQVSIEGDTARQISRVLRMQAGDEVCLLDGTGYEYMVRLTGVDRENVAGEVVEKKQGTGEPRHKVSIYLSLLNKVDKFEWALQKCTEIGASEFTPVRAARSVADVPGAGRMERWERIIQEAAEQSGRSRLPTLLGTITLAEAIKQEAQRPAVTAKEKHVAIMPSPGAKRSLGEVLRATARASVSIMVGPEGGFTEAETVVAMEAGIEPVTLGARTLRAETAAVAALTMVLYELGEMDGGG